MALYNMILIFSLPILLSFLEKIRQSVSISVWVSTRTRTRKRQDHAQEQEQTWNVEYSPKALYAGTPQEESPDERGVLQERFSHTSLQ